MSLIFDGVKVASLLSVGDSVKAPIAREGVVVMWIRSIMTLAAATILAGGIALAGCAADDNDPSSVSQTTAEQTVTVYAAASLKSAFDDIAAKFEAEYGDISVAQILYDGSSTLATQITEGGPADVFASADEKNMATVTDAGLAVSAELFATNTLVVAVPADNPGDVTTLDDLASVTTVLCAPQVPCGSASTRLLENAGVDVKPASLEQNVTAVLEKVAAGDADAGLVYATDVIGDAAAASFVPQGADQVVNRYPITTMKGAAYPEAAQAFVDFVLGEQGQAILEGYGFGSAR